MLSRITPPDTRDKPVSKKAGPQMLAAADRACANPPPFRGLAPPKICKAH